MAAIRHLDRARGDALFPVPEVSRVRTFDEPPVSEPAGVAVRPAPSTAVVDDEHVVDRAVGKARSWLMITTAPPRVEEVLQRTEGVQIEIAGGLIEEQHVRSADNVSTS